MNRVIRYLTIVTLSFTCLITKADDENPENPHKDLIEAIEKEDVKKTKELINEMKDINENLELDYKAFQVECPVLTVAIEADSEELVDFIIQKGADVNKTHTFLIGVKEEFYGSPLALASFIGNEKIVKKLLDAGADTKYKEKTVLSPLSGALTEGHHKVIFLLLERGAEPYNLIPLFANSSYKDDFDEDKAIEMVKYLLFRGADINEVSISTKITALSKFSSKGKLKVFNFLLSKGASIQQVKGEESGPLDCACSMLKDENLEMIKILLSKGADVEARTRNGFTPLMSLSLTCALSSRYGKFKKENALKAMKLLLDAGSDVNAVNNFGKTALDYLCLEEYREFVPEELISLLRKHEAKTSAELKEEKAKAK